MQIVNAQGNIIEKVIRDKEGRLVRARFFVYESAGRIKARLVKWEYLNELSGEILSLTIYRKRTVSENISFSKPSLSPYFSKNILTFLGSKPRAPTHTK